jgi:adenylate kinase family enzyme
MPYLIITNGATGSGKSDLAQKTKQHYGLEGTTHTKFLIDDIIEKNAYYKDAIDKFILDSCDKERTLCQSLQTRLENPDEKVYKLFATEYFKHRGKDRVKTTSCLGEGNPIPITCDDLLDNMLENAFSNQINIEFETKGEYYVDWLVDQAVGYDIYYAFTIVDFCDNVERNKTRALKDMKKYLENGQKAPRLPDVRESSFVSTIRKINKNLWHLMDQQLRGVLPEITKVVVFGNQKGVKEPEILYDSDLGDVKTLIAATKKITRRLNVRKCQEEDRKCPGCQIAI